METIVSYVIATKYATAYIIFKYTYLHHIIQNMNQN